MTILCVYEREPKFPATDQNPDAVRYKVGQKWVDAVGAEPTQDDVDAVLGKDAQSIQARMTAAVQAYLDFKAQQKGYDNILSAASYATSTDETFGPEGIAFRDWRDAVWNYCYQALADVKAGKRTIPTKADLLAELPAIDLQ